MDSKKILDLFSLKGRVAIITGGAGRLGREHAKILRAAGAKVISFDVERPEILEVFSEKWEVDITQKDEVFKAVNRIYDIYRRIDILINNAALNPRVGSDEVSNNNENNWAPHEKYSQRLWMKEFDVGLNGAMYCIQAVAKYMIPKNSGCILNIASTSAITAPDHRKYKAGRFKSAAYPVVKTALLGLTRSWASYFASVAPEIRVNALCPGAVNFGLMEPEFAAKLGERNMLRRPASPDEYAGAVLFLCSDASKFMTAATVVADGGQTAW